MAINPVGLHIGSRPQAQRKQAGPDIWDEIGRGMALVNEGLGVAVNWEKFGALRKAKADDENNALNAGQVADLQSKGSTISDDDNGPVSIRKPDGSYRRVGISVPTEQAKSGKTPEDVAYDKSKDINQQYLSHSSAKFVRGRSEAFDTVKSLLSGYKTGEDARMRDNQLLVAYIKVIDPTSVVSMNEQGAVTNTNYIPDAAKGLYNDIVGRGKLLDTQRRAIYEASRDMYRGSIQTIGNQNADYIKHAGGLGVAPHYLNLYTPQPIDMNWKFQGIGGDPQTQPGAKKSDIIKDVTPKNPSAPVPSAKGDDFPAMYLQKKKEEAAAKGGQIPDDMRSTPPQKTNFYGH